MKLLLLCALALGLLAAPASAGTVVLTRDGHHTTVTARGDLRPDQRFRVGSVTKTFVATVVLQLAAEGRLSLDDPVDRYVPQAPAVSLRQLLNHTSGIYNHADDPRTLDGWPLRQWQPLELVAIALEHPLGTGFHYSNTNYVLLGLVIERVTGRPLAAELERRIIRPLHLRDTTYDEGPNVPGVATGHYGDRDVTVQNTSWAGASGSLVSTANDLARFYGVLDRLLPAAQLAAMKTGDYGLGLFWIALSCGGRAWGHNGIVPGYFTNAFTRGNRTAVVLVNRYPVDERPALKALDAALCS